MSQSYKELKKILPKDLAREIIKYNTPKSDYITDVCHVGLSELISYVDASVFPDTMGYFAYRWDMKDLKSSIAQIYPDKTKDTWMSYWCIYGAIDRGDEQSVINLLEEISDVCKNPYPSNVVIDLLTTSIRCKYDNITKKLLTHFDNIHIHYHPSTRCGIIMQLLYHDMYDMYCYFINLSHYKVDDVDYDNKYYAVFKKLTELGIIETNKTIELAFGGRVFNNSDSDIVNWLVAIYTNDKKTISETARFYTHDLFIIYLELQRTVKSLYETEMLCHILDYINDPGDIGYLFTSLSHYRRSSIHVDLLIKIHQVHLRTNISLVDHHILEKENIEISGDIMKLIPYLNELKVVYRSPFIVFILNNINTSHLRNKKFCDALRANVISDNLEFKEDNYKRYLNFY